MKNYAGILLILFHVTTSHASIVPVSESRSIYSGGVTISSTTLGGNFNANLDTVSQSSSINDLSLDLHSTAMNGSSKFQVLTKIDRDNMYSLAYDYSIMPLSFGGSGYSTVDIEILINGMATKYLYGGFQSARSGKSNFDLNLRAGDDVYFIFNVSNDPDIKTAINVNFAQVVPLPASFVFLGSGLVGFLLWMQKKNSTFTGGYAPA